MSSPVSENKTDFETLEGLLFAIREDAIKFYSKNNNSAGTRLRKGLLEIKNHCHSSRKNIQVTIKARKEEKGKQPKKAKKEKVKEEASDVVDVPQDASEVEVEEEKKPKAKAKVKKDKKVKAKKAE